MRNTALFLHRLYAILYCAISLSLVCVVIWNIFALHYGVRQTRGCLCRWVPTYVENQVTSRIGTDLQRKSRTHCIIYTNKPTNKIPFFLIKNLFWYISLLEINQHETPEISTIYMFINAFLLVHLLIYNSFTYFYVFFISHVKSHKK